MRSLVSVPMYWISLPTVTVLVILRSGTRAFLLEGTILHELFFAEVNRGWNFSAFG